MQVEDKMYLPTVLLRLGAGADHLSRAEYQGRCPRLPGQVIDVFTGAPKENMGFGT